MALMKPENGQTSMPIVATNTYKPRDYNAETRGKVACAAFCAALTSPGLAGLQFETSEEFLAIVKIAADKCVEYTWNH